MQVQSLSRVTSARAPGPDGRGRQRALTIVRSPRRFRILILPGNVSCQTDEIKSRIPDVRVRAVVPAAGRPTGARHAAAEPSNRRHGFLETRRGGVRNTRESVSDIKGSVSSDTSGERRLPFYLGAVSWRLSAGTTRTRSPRRIPRGKGRAFRSETMDARPAAAAAAAAAAAEN